MKAGELLGAPSAPDGTDIVRLPTAANAIDDDPNWGDAPPTTPTSSTTSTRQPRSSSAEVARGGQKGLTGGSDRRI